MSEKQVRVLHFSSHDEDCGVGKYQEQYLVGMAGLPGVFNKFFEISPYQTKVMNPDELEKALDKLGDELEDFDILHIQHEFGLFRDDEFRRMVELAKAKGKKVIVTVHLSPSFAIKPVKLGGIGPRSLVAFARKRKHHDWQLQNHIEPMAMADLLIVHNEPTRRSLKEFGIDDDNIIKMVHPVYEVAQPPKSTEIAESLNRQKGDVIFCVTGFLHKYKGIIAAVKALKYLPPNYKLALLGGVKADSEDVAFQDLVTDLVDVLGLRDRVYITGFVPDDDRLNALIRECDVCVYPYDRVYYSSLSSGSLNLAFANDKPAIAYPTESLKELNQESPGAVVLCSTFAYYELARELQRIDIAKQTEASKQYAQKMAWPKAAKQLVQTYQRVASE